MTERKDTKRDSDWVSVKEPAKKRQRPTSDPTKMDDSVEATVQEDLRPEYSEKNMPALTASSRRRICRESEKIDRCFEEFGARRKKADLSLISKPITKGNHQARSRQKMTRSGNLNRMGYRQNREYRKKRPSFDLDQFGIQRKTIAKKNSECKRIVELNDLFQIAKSEPSSNPGNWEPHLIKKVRKVQIEHKWVPTYVLYNLVKLVESDDEVGMILSQEEAKDRNQFGRGNVGLTALVKSQQERRREESVEFQKQANSNANIDRKEMLAKQSTGRLFTDEELLNYQESSRRTMNSQPHEPEYRESSSSSLMYAIIHSEQFFNQNQLDLHGLNLDSAIEVVAQALTITNFMEPLTVVTGKGKHSKGEPVLKAGIPLFLEKHGIPHKVDARNEGKLIVNPQNEPRNWGLGTSWVQKIALWKKQSWVGSLNVNSTR